LSTLHALHLTILSFNMQDEHMLNYFIKNNILKPIIDAFVANGNRYNLLNSAVLELFEYIRKVLNFDDYSFFILNSPTKTMFH
jgi:hypothetical protein